MLRKLPALVLTLMAVLLFATPVFAQPPNFGRIYVHDALYATKGVATLPPPNEHNKQSYDYLYAFSNGAEGQYSVAEFAPGDTGYNGGRWIVYTVTWANPDAAELLTSFEAVEDYISSGALIVEPGEGYVECPLIPIKN